MKINNFTVRPKNTTVDFSKATNLQKSSGSKEKGTLTGLVKNNMKKPQNGNDRINSLQDRRQELTARRAEYFASAKEKKVDQKIIDAKLAEYDNQIAEVDRQIAQIRKEEREKQAQETAEKTQESAQRTSSAAGQEPETAAAEATEKLMSAFGSVQHTKDYIAAMQDVKGRLNTEASYYAPSHFYHGNPQKYATLKAKAGNVESEIVHLEKDLRKAGDSIMDGVQATTEKTAQEKAVENYKAETDNPDGQEKEKDAMDVYA
jgi:hypothetical protein